MKITVAPDKFKGSLSSLQACKAIEAGIHQIIPDADVLLLPMADGGDGFDEVLKYYLDTKTVTCNTVDPLMRLIVKSYQINTSSRTAIIALASSSGLVLLKEEERNPLYTSTYGTGLLIQHAIENGAEKIILGVGGSATNDAGLGILAALGFALLDDSGVVITPVGKNLQLIKSIVPPAVIPSVNFEIACDVQNILFGKEGAAFVYASQKGASADDILLLDKGLQHISYLIQSSTGKQVENLAGTGAAGGIAAGLMSYFNCRIVSGTGIVAEAAELKDQLHGTDLLITAEGKLDNQSSNGKVVQYIADLGKQSGIPVIALCGQSELNSEEVSKMGLLFVKSITGQNISIKQAMANPDILLTDITRSAVINFIEPRQ